MDAAEGYVGAIEKLTEGVQIYSSGNWLGLFGSGARTHLRKCC